MMAAQQRRVVVTGMGAITPLGTTLAESWQNLIGTNAPDTFTTLEDALKLHQGLPDDILGREIELARMLPSQVAAPVKKVLPSDNRTARFVKLALLAASEALESSKLIPWLGIKGDEDDGEMIRRRERVGVSIGSGMSGAREIASAMHLVHERGPRRLSPHFVPKVLSNSAAGRVSLEYGLCGPNHAVSTACAAGAHAIGDAMRFIQHNNADIVLAGGSEACIDPLTMLGFCRLGALSTNWAPMESSRPFNEGRDGFVISEGACILVLEELQHAKQRGAPVLAEISGYGLSGDAYHVTAPDVHGRGAQRAMNMALKESDAFVGDLYINAHATSTPQGDEIEAYAIDEVLTGKGAINAHPVYVSSTKGHTGHLLGAAGSLEAAFTVLSLVHQIIPPTRNLGYQEETNSFVHVSETLNANGHLRAAMSNSFGFGGTNASLVFRSLSEPE